MTAFSYPASGPVGGFFIGLMSGTSLDGVDGVLVEISATGKLKALLAHAHRPFDPALRAELLALQTPGENELHRAALAGNALAALYAQIVEALLASARIERDALVCVGAHGQTVRHRPELGYTWQLNNPARLAELCSVPVVADFRSRDIAAGGQGAPLVPAFHQAMFAKADRNRLVVNLGGICNITFLDGDEGLSGYDIGPANILLDAWAQQHLGEPFDRNGAWAAIGEVDAELLEDFLAEGFFDQPPPKSTGRDRFNPQWLQAKLAAHAHLAPEDVQRSLVELTATLIAAEVAASDPPVGEIILCGGGAYNGCLRDALALRLAELPKPPRLALSSDFGVAPEHVEAIAFAWLAYQHVNDQPANHPDVTGADDFRVLGAYYPH